MIDKIEFAHKKNKKGFEIVALNSFFESLDGSFLRKHYRTNFYSLIFVTEGVCSHEIDFVDYKVSAGETLIVSNNRVHKYSDFKHINGYIVMFTEGFLCEFLSNQTTVVKDLFKQSYIEPHIKTSDLYTTTLISLLDLIKKMYTYSNNVINEKVIASTFKSVVQIISNSHLEDHATEAKNNHLFMQFTDLVEKHIDHEKSVEAYAKMMHVSEKTINQVTRKAIDTSAKQYIIKQLIQQIKLKLSFEQKSINEIAYEFGFSEASNMSRLFKKYMGFSPNEFRRKLSVDKAEVFRTDSMDLDLIKHSIETKVYHVPSDIVVPLHKHAGHDEIFYCIKGSGHVLLEEGEIELNVGMTFTAKAGLMHSLTSKTDLYVTAVLVPVIDERIKSIVK